MQLLKLESFKVFRLVACNKPPCAVESGPVHRVLKYFADISYSARHNQGFTGRLPWLLLLGLL